MKTSLSITLHRAKLQCTSSNRSWDNNNGFNKKGGLGENKRFRIKNVQLNWSYSDVLNHILECCRVITKLPVTVTWINTSSHRVLESYISRSQVPSQYIAHSSINKTSIRRISCFNNKIKVKSKISKAIKSHSRAYKLIRQNFGLVIHFLCLLNTSYDVELLGGVWSVGREGGHS